MPRGTSLRAPGRPRDVDSQDTERAIRDAALHLFAEVGYGGTTNRAVADRAGVSPGTVYYHFESKQAMFLSVLRDTRQRIRSHLLAMSPADASFAAQLAAMLDAALALHTSEPALATFEAAAAVDVLRHPELAEAVAAEIDDGRAILLHLVAAARARGEVSDEVDDDAVADAITALLAGLSQVAARTPQPRLDPAFRASRLLLAGTLLHEEESQ
jgi:AcrR family transcriptional regulator